MVSDAVKGLVVSPEQMVLDHAMVPSDIWGTQAHVLMLAKTGIVPEADAAKILTALEAISESYQAGNFQIDPERGAQLTLEKEVVERAGAQAGLRMHTARSRNDQVMVTELLYLRERALEIGESIVAVINVLLAKAEEEVDTVMPGYTHMQPGKPASLAQWYLTYAHSLGRVAESIQFTLQQFDKNPLGAVESFGTSWPIDRDFTRDLLGFESVWEVPQDAIAHRGVFQLQILSALTLFGVTLSKFATDLMLYSTFEFRYVDFGDDVAERLHPITGSSVMAQKRNPDALELLRASASQLGGIYQSALSVLTGLPMGYNRDSRDVKQYITSGLGIASRSLDTMKTVVSSLHFDRMRMKESVCKNYSLTTDLADAVAQQTGEPYRKVYKIIGTVVDRAIQAGKSLDQLEIGDFQSVAKEFEVEFPKDLPLELVRDPSLALSRREHIGGTSSERIREQVCSMKALQSGFQAKFAERSTRVVAARAKTKEYVSQYCKPTQ